MRARRTTLGLALLLGLTAPALAQHAGHGIPAPMPGFRAIVLLETPLLGTEDRIYRLYVIDLGPGGATPRHMHPGDEIALVTEGRVVLELAGAAPRMVETGQTLHPPPMVPHVARNASDSAPARLMVTSITEAGKPSTILVPGD